MIVPGPIRYRLLRRAEQIMAARPPDVLIGGERNPYLRRWHIVPRNRVANLYLHEVLRSDDDRALHDHPWPNLSLMLLGRYDEHTTRAGGIQVRAPLTEGHLRFRSARAAHRLQLISNRAITLFATGPKVREWGFHCPQAGWRHWRDFTAQDHAGASIVGRGCGEPD